MRQTIFEKAENLMELVREELPGIDRHRIRSACGRLSNHYAYIKNRKYKPSREEVKVYDVLVRNDISPVQAYKWMLLYDAPAHVKALLRQKKISIKTAFKIISGDREAGERVTAGRRELVSHIISSYQVHIHPMMGTP
ncbi:hypothetical protein JXA85_02520 [Candidatus Woesearchaeota archaeon]|nr:hypothetical protein [Candidatus Woesearchaeota archaeon]